MIQLIRCNNCHTIYKEDSGNADYVFKCEKCNSEAYLMDITEEEAQ